MKASLFFVTWLTLGPCVVLFTKGSRDLETANPNHRSVTLALITTTTYKSLLSDIGALATTVQVSVWRHWRSRYKSLLSDIGILDTSRWSAILATKGLNVIRVFYIML